MISDLVRTIFDRASLQLEWRPYISTTWLIALVIPFLAWLLWRLWTFTVLPYFHPEEPKNLPHWIPCKPIPMTSYFSWLTLLLKQILVSMFLWVKDFIILTSESGHAASFFKDSHRLMSYGV